MPSKKDNGFVETKPARTRHASHVLPPKSGRTAPPVSAGSVDSPRWMSGRQGNHQPWVLPASLVHLAEPCLYMAVAWWGLLKTQPFTRADVSAAFRITPRRAADVMEHIYKERRDIIESEYLVGKGAGSGTSEARLRILSVREEQATSSPAPARRMASKNTRPTRSTTCPLQEKGESLLQLWHRLTQNKKEGGA